MMIDLLLIYCVRFSAILGGHANFIWVNMTMRISLERFISWQFEAMSDEPMKEGDTDWQANTT